MTTRVSTSLPVFALLGIACGLLAVVICKGLFLVEAGFRRLPVSEFWHPIIGALGFAAVGLVVPARSVSATTRSTTCSPTGSRSERSRCCWSASSSRGGSPSGRAHRAARSLRSCSSAARFGGLLGDARQRDRSRASHVSPGAVALVAMAATFGAATRATFTSIVFAFELTRDYRRHPALMLAAVIADLVAGALLEHGLMTEKLARRGPARPARLHT